MGSKNIIAYNKILLRITDISTCASTLIAKFKSIQGAMNLAMGFIMKLDPIKVKSRDRIQFATVVHCFINNLLVIRLLK